MFPNTRAFNATFNNPENAQNIRVCFGSIFLNISTIEEKYKPVIRFFIEKMHKISSEELDGVFKNSILGKEQDCIFGTDKIIPIDGVNLSFSDVIEKIKSETPENAKAILKQLKDAKIKRLTLLNNSISIPIDNINLEQLVKKLLRNIIDAVEKIRVLTQEIQNQPDHLKQNEIQILTQSNEIQILTQSIVTAEKNNANAKIVSRLNVEYNALIDVILPKYIREKEILQSMSSNNQITPTDEEVFSGIGLKMLQYLDDVGSPMSLEDVKTIITTAECKKEHPFLNWLAGFIIIGRIGKYFINKYIEEAMRPQKQKTVPAIQPARQEPQQPSAPTKQSQTSQTEPQEQRHVQASSATNIKLSKFSIN